MMHIDGIRKRYEISQSDCFWNMVCRLDDNIKKLNHDDIKNSFGVYIFWDWEDNPIRIGKAQKVRNRILSYYTNHMNNYIFESMENELSFVSVIYTKSEMQNIRIESDLLKKHRPKYNFIGL